MKRKKRINSLVPVDVTVQNEGTIVLFRTLTPEAKEWWIVNVNDDAAMMYCGAHVVGHRYARDIFNGMIDARLNVAPYELWEQECEMLDAREERDTEADLEAADDAQKGM